MIHQVPMTLQRIEKFIVTNATKKNITPQENLTNIKFTYHLLGQSAVPPWTIGG